VVIAIFLYFFWLRDCSLVLLGNWTRQNCLILTVLGNCLHIIGFEDVEVFFFMLSRHVCVGCFGIFLRSVCFLVLWKDDFLEIVKFVSVSALLVSIGWELLLVALFSFLFHVLNARVRLDIVLIIEEFLNFVSVLITLVATSFWGFAFVNLHGLDFGLL